MKKKIFTIALVTTAILSFHACGKKEVSSNETPSSAVETTQDTTVEPTLSDSENSIIAKISSVADQKLTLNDGEATFTFDISNAKLPAGYTLMPEDEVEVIFTGENPSDGMSADVVNMITPFEDMDETYNEDPSIQGTVTAYDGKTISILDDGKVSGNPDGAPYTFTISDFAQTIAKNQIKAGDGICIYYFGEITGSPEAVRLVSSDMDEDTSGAADRFAVTGTIKDITDGILTLEAGSRTFKFTEDSVGIFASVKPGDSVSVEYYGSLQKRVIPALLVQAE